MTQYEIERKFLIYMPTFLERLEHRRIFQTYLTAVEGSRRVRKSKYSDKTVYTFTEKHRVSDKTHEETECEISEAEYNSLLSERDENCRTIEKIRYKYPYQDHIFEIDVYPFWKKQCVMEVEMVSEDEVVAFPPDIQIIAEVTSDHRYKNVSLAQKVPVEVI